jgi:hypothetical protein
MLMFERDMEGWKKVLVHAAGVGAGAVIALVTICGIGYWWMERPKPWTDKAISAKFNELDFQQVGEQVNFTFQYELQNNTSHEYVVPAPGVGALMRQMPEKGSYDRIDDSSWNNDLIIPPKQRLNIKFVVPCKFADYNTSFKELGDSSVEATSSADVPKKLLEFVDHRLKEMDGFVFFDYGKKYIVRLPSGWQRPKP